MNYLMLVCGDGVASEEKTATMHREMPGWVEEMDGRGIRKLGEQLADPETAVTVRVRDGQTLVTDGPFAETKEFVGGFDILDCADLDEAIEVAAKHPVSWYGSIEVRPFFQMGGALDQELGEVGPPPAGRQRYMLLVCIDGIPGSDAEEAQIRVDAERWLELTGGRGAQVFGHALQHPDTATTVRVRDGQTMLSDGPFAETKEFICGFDILDVSGREEAIELAAAHPLAAYHRVEVRRFAEFD